jgi:hypothetical protein
MVEALTGATASDAEAQVRRTTGRAIVALSIAAILAVVVLVGVLQLNAALETSARLRAQITDLRSQVQRRNSQLQRQRDTVQQLTILVAQRRNEDALALLQQEARPRRRMVSRVFFNLRSEEQRQLASRCGVTIGGDYRMPPPAIGTRGPPTAEVRYFHAGEESYAQDVAQRLQGCLGTAPAVRQVPGFDVTPPLIAPRQFEIWLPPAAGTPALARASARSPARAGSGAEGAAD